MNRRRALAAIAALPGLVAAGTAATNTSAIVGKHFENTIVATNLEVINCTFHNAGLSVPAGTPVRDCCFTGLPPQGVACITFV